MNICSCCGRSNKRTKYFDEYDCILCDSCLLMYKKYPIHYIPPMGEIHHDSEGNIICHVCGRSFKKLSIHIQSKHKLSTSEYKEKFGLNRGSSLTGKNFKSNICVDVTTVSANTRFTKGHTKSKCPRRLQAKKNRKLHLKE